MRLTVASVFAGCVVLAGCSGAQRVASDAEVEESGYVRVVNPFEVRDSTGALYEHAFLGGLNVPRPQFIDIDGDGDEDLFLQEVPSKVMFFERLDGPEPRFEWRSDQYGGLEVGEWYRFGDLDHDGDFDLLAEERFSYIRYYRNEGTPMQPRFVLATDSLRDTSGEAIFADRQNIPNLTDIDCDGKTDLFIGRIDGTVVRYEEVDVDENNVPRFQLITERFEDIEIVSQFMSMHGANSLTFGDVDEDGDVDLFWGDFFEPGLLLIENTGSCGSPVFRGVPAGFPANNPVTSTGYNAPALTDADLDGDLDVFIGVLGGAFNANRSAADNFYYLEHQPNGDYELRAERFLTTIDIGSESFPAFIDDDGDGDQDLYLSNKIDPENPQSGSVYRFENVGTAQAPAFARRDRLPLKESYHYAPAFVDLDADGDLDMVMGSWKKQVAYHENTGTVSSAQFEETNPELVTLTRGSNTTPALVDIDADGDYDLFVGETSGTINYYENTGTATSPTFELISDEYLDIDIGRRSVPVFYDHDGDGDHDLLVGSESSGIVLFRNDGTPEAPAFVEAGVFMDDLPAFATPAFIDIDADGDDDLVTGSVAGGILFFEYR